ncbi:zinc ribbon domain-containing protein [Pseudoalteromonas xiamenensis]
MNKNCQSCNMPIKGDPEKQGTNSDGTKNNEYCVYCYQNGAFTQPEFSVKDMQEFCIVKMKEMGLPKPLGWLFTRGIPKLKRWSK